MVSTRCQPLGWHREEETNIDRSQLAVIREDQPVLDRTFGFSLGMGTVEGEVVNSRTAIAVRQTTTQKNRVTARELNPLRKEYANETDILDTTLQTNQIQWQWFQSSVSEQHATDCYHNTL